MTVNDFSSPLAQYFREFVAMKHALGYKYEGALYHLRMLDKMCTKYSDGHACLSKETVDAWTVKRPNESVRTQGKRISLMNEVGEFLIQRDIQAHIFPTKRRSFHSPTAFVPYIFTHEQVKVFLQAADRHPAHRAHPVSNHMYSVLFRILYCCGLRLSEALKLKYNDIDLKNGILTVRDAKFGSDRLVPMTESLCELCSVYIPTIRAHLPHNPHIFPTRFSADPVTSESAYTYFRKILWEAGISHGGRGKGPRVHDFRHTFSVHSLQQWVADGKDIYVALPILATYLGHDDLKVTEKYLRLTAEVFPEMLKLSEAYSQAVMPEVKFYETD